MEDTVETTSWFSGLVFHNAASLPKGMEDPFLSDEYDLTDFFDEELCAALGEEPFQNSSSQQCNSSSSSTMIPRNSSNTSLSASSNMETPKNGEERPSKQHKPNNYNTSRKQAPVASSPLMIIPFANSNTVPEKINPQQLIVGAMNLEDDNSVSEMMISRGSYSDLEEACKSVHTKMKTCSRRRPPSQTYDHIIAERKRRELLSRQFVSLSSIVPGLKKMDKISILGDTIKYLKLLQECEKALEEQAKTAESLVLVKKSQLLIDYDDHDDEKGLSDDDHDQAAGKGCSIEEPLPEIEAKVCDKNVLLRILCEKHTGVLVKILSALGKLNLNVTHTNVASFGSLALDITIITEMRKDFHMSMKELGEILGSILGHKANKL